MPHDIVSIVIIFAGTFLTDLIHSTVGMGFGIGTTFTFLMLGYNPTEVVTSLLISQTIGQIIAAFFNQKNKTVNFNMESRELKIVIVLVLLSLTGAVIGPLVEVNVPKDHMKLYVAFSIIVLGGIMLKKQNSLGAFSWTKLSIVGISAGFFKGLTGCGYGPITTSGQVIVGIDGKKAVGVTMLAGPIVYLTSIITYMLSNAAIDWSLSLYMALAVIVASPIGAFFLKRTNTKRMIPAISIATIAMGILIILKTLIV